MAGITLSTATARLDDYLAAEAAVLKGQSYKIGERELRRADIAAIREGIDYWQAKVTELTQKDQGKRRHVTARPGW